MSEPGSYTTQTDDMLAVHHALLGALDAAAELVGGAHDAARVELIASFYDNVLEFLHVHHSGEDELIYPVLEERCEHSRASLERIDDQHKLLYEPMDAAWASIERWRSEPNEENARSVIKGIALIDQTLRPHLAEEETSVLPLCGAWISQEEWDQLPGHAMMTFRKDKPWLALGLVRETLTPQQRDAMLAGMPAEMQAVWTNEWEPAFIAFMAQVRS